jgi:hypothetical protein
VEQTGALRDDGDVLAQVRDICPAQDRAVKRDAARCGVIQALQERSEDRSARAQRSNDRNELVWAHVEWQALQNGAVRVLHERRGDVREEDDTGDSGAKCALSLVRDGNRGLEGAIEAAGGVDDLGNVLNDGHELGVIGDSEGDGLSTATTWR